jgi:hypothetical protein
MFRFTVAACAFLFAPSALAQNVAYSEPDKVDAPKKESSDVSRPWLYNDDPTIAAPMRVVAAIGDTYSGNDKSTTRAFSSHDTGPGGKANVSLQLGLVRMLALDVTGVLGGYGSAISGGVMAGARFAPFDQAKHGFRFAIGAGYLLDLDQASGAYARVTASYDVGRVRLAAMVHGEHVFRTGQDALDVFATAGVSVRLAPAFRLGVEYIVQDIEEAFASSGTVDPDNAPLPGKAEGGVHQFVGLGGTFDLLHHKLFINFGPALAFRPEIGQVAPVGRALVSYSF